MNQLILNNMALFSALAVCAAITFIAYILNKSVQAKESTLISHDYNDLLDRISRADSYTEICDLESEIDEFDYRHNHEVECGRMLMELHEVYSEKRYKILAELAKSAVRVN
ncbi:MAG TPA: hypothetical protein PL085_11685 [Agriterribacter sp.]|uniref:hypothetical protein n=1 Tax=Agriterribacter sp. TaxID=2821509 RepID=UPI002BE1CA58|nr:hypothetical protein [Agriterribacter sp.]HRQ17730.1 hypothetical protein [Agriterribacter sp.]